jgi:protein-L-isoaspartate(D-aspartate) O-methyltransferase
MRGSSADGATDPGSTAARPGTQAGRSARARLARSLRDSGRAPSPAVLDAFASVPRHLFVPGVAPDAAYADDALVIKYDASGVPVSSSSQPAMMAIMLEQLGLEPGHRVLEIGTGSGYNAAVLAHITGPAGRVVTVDIDQDLVADARDRLVAAGFPEVTVRCADGGFGAPDAAPFDRVIVTAGAWDIAPAWLDQLGPGGRLVLPLALRGIQLSACLRRPGDDRVADHWIADSAFRCGFVRMAGAFADPAPFRPIGPSWYAQADGDAPLDAADVAEALAGPAAGATTGVTAASPDELGDLDLWLTLTQLDLGRLTVITGEAGGLPPFGGLTAAAPGGPGIAMLAGAAGEISVRGYGPGGPALAARLAGLVPDWAGQGRPGTANLRLSAWPASTAPRPAPGQVILARPNVALAAGWPRPEHWRPEHWPAG